jgi:hypothetical protein
MEKPAICVNLTRPSSSGRRARPYPEVVDGPVMEPPAGRVERLVRVHLIVKIFYGALIALVPRVSRSSQFGVRYLSAISDDQRMHCGGPAADLN